MSEPISLESIDVDGALRDAAEAVGFDRAQFLRRGAVTGGSFLALGGLAFPASALADDDDDDDDRDEGLNSRDRSILNFALTLEYLEAEFYADALAANIIKDPLVLVFAQVTGQHEAEHVEALKGLLGDRAVKKPTFDFSSALKDEATFKATAQVLEDTGVAAYAGQGPRIKRKSLVVAALSIHSVEARHAAWIRFLNGGGAVDAPAEARPAPVAFDQPLTKREVLAAVAATGFITG